MNQIMREHVINYLVEVLNQSRETILGKVIQNTVLNKIIAHRLKSLNSIVLSLTPIFFLI